jgi:GT2 family glycosyltransferase
MISLIIPTTSKNKNYTQNILNNIREIYPNENEVEVIIEENDNVTLGVNYNNAVAKANGEKIILLHNDMVIKPGFVETMDKHITKGRITTYTRVEPPIFPDTYPGKVLLDCGSDIDNFNNKKFNEFNIEENLTDGGSQLFFGCMKEDYIGIDGYTFKMFCEDDDLHLRYKLAGFEHKVSSACVYHFVSKTSRTTTDYQAIEQQSNINFIKKWGFRNSIYNTVYKKSIIIHNSNPHQQLEQALNPWFNGGQDIIVEVDGGVFNQDDFDIIQQLNDIVKKYGEIGSFELGNLKITINSMDEYQNDFIKI